MSLFSLFSDNHGFLATDQLVYTTDQLQDLQNANAMATNLAAALADQNRINETAKSDGFSAGYEKGKQRAKEECRQAMEQATIELHKVYQSDVLAQREACATLAVDIVRKIAGQVAPADWLFAEASTAAGELIDQTGLTLRVHANHFESVSKRVAGDKLFDRVVADETIASDACRIDTCYGTIEVDLETQIDRVLSLFAKGTSSNG